MDHDHRTHLIRGLLCHSCNRVEPHSPHPRWQAWRDGEHAAARLGIVEEYDYQFPGQRWWYDQMNKPVDEAALDAIADAVTLDADVESEAAIARLLEASWRADTRAWLLDVEDDEKAGRVPRPWSNRYNDHPHPDPYLR